MTTHRQLSAPPRSPFPECLSTPGFADATASAYELLRRTAATGANITTAGDALWWAYVTATTVGYGDQFPVTTGGRIAGVLMLTVGVALFATFSGFLANLFLSASNGAPEQNPADSESDLHVTLRPANGSTSSNEPR